MKNYKMTVEIPILNVPDDVDIQAVKITNEIWLQGKIPDAELVSFEEQK